MCQNGPPLLSRPPTTDNGLMRNPDQQTLGVERKYPEKFSPEATQTPLEQTTCGSIGITPPILLKTKHRTRHQPLTARPRRPSYTKRLWPAAHTFERTRTSGDQFNETSLWATPRPPLVHNRIQKSAYQIDHYCADPSSHSGTPDSNSIAQNIFNDYAPTL